MILTHGRRTTGTTAGALLVLLSIVVVLPSRAVAGCGHDVVSRSDPSFRKAMSELRVLDSPGESIAAPKKDAHRDLPCSGPSCGRGSQVPESPSPVPSSRGEEWCCTTRIPALTTACPSANLDPSMPQRPLHRADQLSRPPR